VKDQEAPRGGQKTRTLYILQRDALEELELTPRQLRSWTDAGLFKRQLESPRGVLTRRDIDRLKVLRTLIVDYKMELQVVGDILADADIKVDEDLAKRSLLLDLKTGWIDPTQRAQSADLSELAKEISDTDLERELDVLIIRLFQKYQQDARGRPNVYQAARDAFVDRIAVLDLLSRAYFWNDGPDADAGMSHPLPSDPELSGQDCIALNAEREFVLAKRTLGVTVRDGVVNIPDAAKEVMYEYGY